MASDVCAQFDLPTQLPCNLLGNEAVAAEMEAAAARGQSSGSGVPAFCLWHAESTGRALVEAYIGTRFQEVYGARLHHFMPWLLSYGKPNDMQGALGLRRAECAPLFLEQYLDLPVEAVLAEKAGVPVNRADIVEIGNLVATARGGSRLLFLVLAELCAAADLTWAIFTATPEVQHLLQKLTDNQLVLCRADGARLGAELADWGTYYNTRPAVVAVNVRAERGRSLARPRISELLEVCRPQATAFAQQLVEVGL